MIQTIGWILNKCGVTLRIGIRAKPKQDFTRVVHVAVRVQDYDVS
jgi:hypothetical protein